MDVRENIRKLFYIVEHLSFLDGHVVEKTLHTITSELQALVGADSGVLFIYDTKTHTYTKRIDYPKGVPCSGKMPRRNGLTWEIINDSDIFINDTELEPSASHAKGAIDAKSIMGVSFPLDERAIAILYLRSCRKYQFNKIQFLFLKSLVSIISANVNSASILINSNLNIEDATDKLFFPDDNFRIFCNEIVNQYGFEYSALQVKNPEEQTIETVMGVGSASAITGLVKHSIRGNASLRDIQADVVQEKPLRIEIIKGWYQKFDRYIYKKLKHEDFVRVWVPIILVRDRHGRVVPFSKWINLLSYVTRLDRKQFVDQVENGSCERSLIIIRTWVLKKKDYYIEVIGTCDAGYNDAARDILPDQAIALFEFSASRANKIYESQLSAVLDVIAEETYKVLNTVSLSIHYPFDVGEYSNSYIAYRGKNHKFLTECKPRKKGLGQRAIEQGKPLSIPGVIDGKYCTLDSFNPTVAANNIQSMTAFPFYLGEKSGVIYVHYKEKRSLSKEELSRGKYFGERAAKAVEYATKVIKHRDNYRTLDNLHNVYRSLINDPNRSDLLCEISGLARNILGADLVTVYEYIQSDKRFIWSLDKVGKFRSEWKPEISIGEYSPAQLLVEVAQGNISFNDVTLENNIYYCADPLLSPVINNPKRCRPSVGALPFIERESIRSTIGIVLEHENEILGVLFINYRHSKVFDDGLKKIVQQVQYAAVNAIRSRRTMMQAYYVSNLIDILNLIGHNNRLAHIGVLRQRILDQRQAINCKLIDAAIKKQKQLVELISSLSKLLVTFRGEQHCHYIEGSRLPNSTIEVDMLERLISESKCMDSHDPVNLENWNDEILDALFGNKVGIAPVYWDTFTKRVEANKKKYAFLLEAIQYFTDKEWPRVVREKKNQSSEIKKRWIQEDMVLVPKVYCGNRDDDVWEEKTDVTIYYDHYVSRSILEIMANVIHRDKKIKNPKEDRSNIESDMWYFIELSNQYIEIEFINSCGSKQMLPKKTYSHGRLEAAGGCIAFEMITAKINKLIKTKIKIPTISKLAMQ